MNESINNFGLRAFGSGLLSCRIGPALDPTPHSYWPWFSAGLGVGGWCLGLNPCGTPDTRHIKLPLFTKSDTL